MTMDFAAAMRAATKLTRAQKLMEATRVIQGALLLGRGQDPSEPAHEQGVEERAIEGPATRCENGYCRAPKEKGKERNSCLC
jgi:hypothetical protein